MTRAWRRRHQPPPRHPGHLTRTAVVNGLRLSVLRFPDHPYGREGRRRRRDCRRAGGHWWHPADSMILWRCCACGASRDGHPADGT